MALFSVYPNIGVSVYRTTKVPNGILIGLIDQGKTWVTKYYKLFVLLKKKYKKNVSEIMFR